MWDGSRKTLKETYNIILDFNHVECGFIAMTLKQPVFESVSLYTAKLGWCLKNLIQFLSPSIKTSGCRCDVNMVMSAPYRRVCCPDRKLWCRLHFYLLSLSLFVSGWIIAYTHIIQDQRVSFVYCSHGNDVCMTVYFHPRFNFHHINTMCFYICFHNK